VLRGVVLLLVRILVGNRGGWAPHWIRRRRASWRVARGEGSLVRWWLGVRVVTWDREREVATWFDGRRRVGGGRLRARGRVQLDLGHAADSGTGMGRLAHRKTSLRQRHCSRPI
jgi:hypothetical protein